MEADGGMFTNSCGLKVLFLPMILLMTIQTMTPMLTRSVPCSLMLVTGFKILQFFSLLYRFLKIEHKRNWLVVNCKFLINGLLAYQWVSHRNNHGNICGVDFIWLLNPNNRRKPLKDSWNEAVFGIIKVFNSIWYGAYMEYFVSNASKSWIKTLKI